MLIDDGGTLGMEWDNGRTLGVVLRPGGDVVRRIQEDPHDYEEIVDDREEDEIPLDNDGRRT